MAYRWRSRELTLPVTMAAILTVSGCGVFGGPRGASSEGASSARPRPSATSAEASSLAKEGWFGPTGPLHARVEMRGVERFADRSVLRLTVTSLEDEARHTGNAFGTAAGDFGSYRIPLIDPVGGKVYHPLTDKVGTLGSKPGYYQPGVRYETVVYYPPIPADVRTVTAITAGTAGEFTGVPVVDGTGSGGAVSPTAAAGGPLSPTAAPGSTPAPGATVSWPVRKPAGPITSSVQDLYGITEGTEKTTTASGGDETVGLRTDVLFAFDSDRLTARARAVLDDVAKETREKADPAKPPILVEGHTDGKGTHAYNMGLSLRRAEAVREEVQARLGGAYRYRATGKGETEPVAREGGADDEEARAKNRRVEISYRIRQRTGGTMDSEAGSEATSGATETRADEPTAGGGRPAPFHADDGETVASRTYTRQPSGQRLRIDVKPFYRDGAYLVAVFDIVNLGPGDLGAGTGYGGDIAYIGGWYTGFSVVDPASRTVYRAVRMGPDDPRGPDDYVDPGWATFNVKPDAGNRGFFYVPAPPPDVTSVTFDAGPFGRIDHVPVR